VHFLITGSAGFLGFHFSRFLLENGYEVTLVDRFSDYYSSSLKENRAKNLLDNFGASTLQLDLSNSEQVKSLQKSDFTHIIHLAGQPGVRVTQFNQLDYLNDNITSFANIVDLAVKLKVQNFIYASSSSIYQNALNNPFSESETLEIPTNFYARTKFINEKIIESFSHLIPNICGLRFFSVYGPWGRPDMAYFKLFQAAYSGDTFRLNGNGEISRDFTFVGDVVKSVAVLINSQKNYPRVLNIGGGNVYQMNELISTIQEVTGKSIDIEYMPENLQDLKTTRAETLLQELILGSSPTTNLLLGLTSMNDWISSLENSNEFLTWK
jgi:UDP-glucuronate 4-epimerase